MQIIGVDLHTRQQTVAMLNVETGEIAEKTLRHEGDAVREFYSTLAGNAIRRSTGSVGVAKHLSREMYYNSCQKDGPLLWVSFWSRLRWFLL